MNTMRRSLPTPFTARLLAALSFSALLAACVGDLPDDFNNDGAGGETTGQTTGTGSGGSGGAGTTTSSSSTGTMQAGDFSISASAPAMAAELRSDTEIPVTIATTDFTGAVELSVDGLPAGVTAVFDPPSVNLAGADATATLRLTTTSDMTAGAFPLVINGTSGAVSKTANINFQVDSVITITIPMGVAGLLNTTNSFGAYPTTIKAPTDIANNPVTVRFFNADGVPRTIHAANDAAGFPHGVDIPAGQFEANVRNVTATGTFDYYMHGITGGDTIQGRIVIQQ